MNLDDSNMRKARFRAVACILTILLPLVSLSAQKTDAELYQEAESRFRSKEYVFALDRYTRLTQEYPRSPLIPDAQFRSAVSLFRIGRQDEALALLLKIQERYTSTRFAAFVPFWIGVIEYNNGNYQDAATALGSYLDAGDPSLLRQARLYLAICQNELGDTENAVAQLEQLVFDEFDPSAEAYALTFLASIYVKLGRYAEALDLASSTMASGLSGTDGLRMQLYKAESLWNTGRHHDARAVYDELVKAPPEISAIAYQRLFAYHQIYGNEEALQKIVLDAETELAGYSSILAEFWLRIGIESYLDAKYDLAESYFLRVWNMRGRIPVSGLVPVYLAEIELEKGRNDEALRYLTTYLAGSDDRRELITFKIGAIHLKAGRFDEAATVFSDFLAEYPASATYPEAAYQNAYALYRLGKFEPAIELVSNILSTARGGSLTSSFLLLKSVLHKGSGDLLAATASLREYLPLNESDARARMDLIKLYFRMADFQTVIDEIELVVGSAPFDEPATPYSLLVRYMYGLAHISQQQYQPAVDILSVLTLDHVRNADLLPIYPYILYYRGWALYRSGNYLGAEQDFAALIDGVPDHELQPRAAYLAGWCAYIQGRHQQAGAYLKRVDRSAGDELQTKSDFMYAKTLRQLGKIEEAAILFENIHLENPESELSDDALFEYAEAVTALDQLENGVEAYLRVWQEYPASLLAEESLYLRGELLFEAEHYGEARDAFYQYRLRYPRGSLNDAALYWGGLAAFESGEAFGAVLLWEKLIGSYPKSAFRADSLLRTAEVYEESGDFRKALNFYGELSAVYPEEAEAVSADLRSEKLRFLILGQGEQEAELSAIRSRDGTESPTGRAAAYELARIYIYKSGSKQDLAPELLDILIAQADTDPVYAAKAHYLYGEYYYRKNELQKAAESFLQTVLTNPTDKDLSAQALFRAAEMAMFSGNRSDAETLVARIESLFPSSSWLDEGRKLLEGRDE